MPQQPRGRRHRQQLLLPGRLRRVGAAGAAHMTISGAQGRDCSAGLGVYVPGSGQAAKGLIAGITPGPVRGPQAGDHFVAQLHLERRARCPIRVK